MEDTEKHDDVPAIRDALMAPRRLSRTLFSSSLSPEYIHPAPVTSLAEGAWSAYQRGDLGRVVTALPGLIKTTQQMDAASADDAAYRRACAAVSARIHHLAATTLSKIGEADLAWIAAERAMQAADEADDPLVLASAARSGTHALLAVGRFADALELGAAAARWLEPKMAAGNPAALSLYGMLHLRTAVAAARHQDRSTANELLGHASRAADQLGEDANYWFTGFGPSNVELHKVSAALDLGDISQVIEMGSRINVDHLPVERQVTHLIDLARAYGLVAKDDDALQTLLTAEHKSPAIVRHSTAVREVVRSMYRRAPATAARNPRRFSHWPSAVERSGKPHGSRTSPRHRRLRCWRRGRPRLWFDLARHRCRMDRRRERDPDRGPLDDRLGPSRRDREGDRLRGPVRARFLTRRALTRRSTATSSRRPPRTLSPNSLSALPTTRH